MDSTIDKDADKAFARSELQDGELLRYTEYCESVCNSIKEFIENYYGGYSNVH